MSRRARKLALLLCLSVTWTTLAPAPLRAQQNDARDSVAEEEDDDAPQFVELSPASGTVIAAREVTITGRVSDASPVMVHVDEVTAKADAAGRFTLKGIPIKQGKNEMTVIARDAAGNDAEQEIKLIGKDLVPPVAPVVFAVKPATRLPFQVVEGRAEPEARVVISGGAEPAVADAAYGTGLFSAFVRLREGVNALTAVAVDDAGTSPPVRVSVKRVAAEAPPDGEPAQINVSSGGAQRGLPGAPFTRPLVVLVTDRRGRPVAGVGVEFTIRHGDARFAGGVERLATKTGADGRARAQLTAGKTFGIQFASADFAGNTSSPARFDVETIKPRSDGLTNVSGVVLDWYGHPHADIPVKLGGRTTRTASDGRFTFERARPGAGQRLEIFGESVTAGDGRWADVSYPIDVLPGTDNDMGLPLYVSHLNDGPALDAGALFALDAEGRVTTDGAELFWHDGSGREGAPAVKLRRGVRVGVAAEAVGLAGRPSVKSFSATIVGGERAPTSLDDGLSTSLYVFVRPRRVTFDAPLPIRMPNLDSLAPGARVLVMRYDDASGRWAKDGGARVSDDGQTVESDEGSGIRGGGWYAFAGERTYAEYTAVHYLQVEGNPDVEDRTIVNIEVSSGGKRGVMMSWWHEGYFKRLHFRVTMPALGDDIILGSSPMIHRDSSREAEVTLMPVGHAMEPGEKVRFVAVGRPHPGGYYLWSSSDSGVVSIAPAAEGDGGGAAQHPNNADATCHQLGRAKITVSYVTPAGQITSTTAAVSCRKSLPRAPAALGPRLSH